MHNYIALILVLVVPAFGQLAQGIAKVRISGMHNHWAMPTDGGKLYAYGMQGTANCQSGFAPIQNDAAYTGSGPDQLVCGGLTPPTITATGLNVITQANAVLDVAPNFANGFTLAQVFNPTSVSHADIPICGMINFDNPVDTTQQYSNIIGWISNGDVGFLYDLAGTVHAFTTAGATLPAGSWSTIVVKYKSATPGTAVIWKNNSIVAGSWVTGNGTAALPAVQVETTISTTQVGTADNCVGTTGYAVGFDHDINTAAEGFIYRAMYRTMQFRQVAVP